MDWDQLLYVIISALLGGGLVSFLTARATAAAKVSEAAGNLAEHYDRKLRHLEAYQTRQARYIRYLLRGIGRLDAQIVDLGHVPIWEPREMDAVCPPGDEA